MFTDYLHDLQFVAFSIAQVTNGFLIFQIVTKTEKMIGNYKYLMLVFACSSLAYGWIDIFTLPLMHVKGSIYVVFVTSFMKDSPILGKILVYLIDAHGDIGSMIQASNPKSLNYWMNDGQFQVTASILILTSIFCSSFALVISLLSAQFLYRYLILCRTSILNYFDGYKIILIFLPGILCTFIWFQLAFWFACCTPEKQELLRGDLQLYYGENTSTVPFSAIMFWSRNETTGEKIWMGYDLTAAIGCGIIVYGCFFVILFCAWKTHYTLKTLSDSMSQRTLDINRQMFKTLIAQTILPFVFVFTPSGVVLTLPLLELYEGPLVNIVGITVAFYPSLEPIVTIICMKEFRTFSFCKRGNRTHPTENSCAIT